MKDRTNNWEASICFADDGAAGDTGGGAGATPAAEAPAPAPAPEAGAFGDSELHDIFTFDPFAKEDSTSPTANPTPPAAEPPKGAEPTPAAQPEPTPQAGLEATLGQLKQVNEQLLERMQGQGQGQQPEVPDAPFADVRVPAELVNALRSDDPAEVHTAINLMVQGAATMAYNRAKAELASFVNEGLPTMMAGFQQHTQTAKTVETDFYGKYPELNKAEFKPMIAQIAMSVAQELNAKGQFTGWNEGFRDAVAERFIRMFQGLMPAPAAPAAPSAPFQPPGGARPSSPSADPAVDIMNTLF